MKLILVAVGTRMPNWVDSAFDDFAKRMPRELPLQLVEIKAEPRTTGKTVENFIILPALIAITIWLCSAHYNVLANLIQQRAP